MSEAKSIKERVMEIFNTHKVDLKVEEVVAEETVQEEEVKLMESELEDGQIVYTDAEVWDEGVNVYVKNDDDEKIPVPAGEYPLKDGGVLVVEEDGIVKEIRVEEVKEEVVEEEMKEEVEATAQLTKDDVLSIIDKALGEVRSEFKTQLAEKEKEIEKIKTEFKHEGLPRAIETKPAVEIDLSKLSNKERVKAIFEQNN